MNPELLNTNVTDAERDKIIENIIPDRSATEEEFQNFMQRVTEVEKIVKKLSSTDEKEQESGMLLADMVLEGCSKKNNSNDDKVRVKYERTVINKIKEDDADPNKVSQEAFMRGVERDANERAEDRKRRNERAETYKKIGDGAFGIGDYEKAATYYGKAVEQRKDSALLWNNRALSYMRMELWDKALRDIDWALKNNETNIKALLNGAKCHDKLANHVKRDEFIKIARETNPKYINYIDDFAKKLGANADPENDEN